MMKKYGDYFVTIGLEIHVALKTKEKLFSSTQNDFDTKEISWFDAGLPGVLPVISKEATQMAIAFGHAVGAEVRKHSIFERKHYFYPDLPLGYQITQQHWPIVMGGEVTLDDGTKVIIEHAHLECDAAKSIHNLFPAHSAIDLARCASPLIEIVSTPCLHSPEHAKQYAKSIHGLVSYMGICDGKIEEGSFRVDASISLSKTEKLGTRVEIKNISSFSFLEQALYYEIERQQELLDAGKSIDMETRLFDEASGTTQSMRSKETVAEYRYLTDPDITPLVFDEAFEKQAMSQYDTHYYARIEQLAALFAKTQDSTLTRHHATLCLSGMLSQEWLMFLANEELQTLKIEKLLAHWYPEVIAKTGRFQTLTQKDLILLDRSELQAKECKQALEQWLEKGGSLSTHMPSFISVLELQNIVLTIFSKYKEQVDKYHQGETKMLQYLIGKVMSEVKGKAPATMVREIVEKELIKN